MWNWQYDTWASFEYDPSQIQPVDLAFLQGSGFLFGVFEHLSQQDKHNIIIDVLSTEAVKTSAIEGEVLNRDSVQASLRRSFGLEVDHRKVPALLSLSYAIEQNKKAYYSHLEASNRVMEITPWLLYFSEVIFQAQQYTQKRLEFLIAKAKFYDQFRGMFNPRQEKAIARMFHEGFEGFTGGLSAKNYKSITKAPTATATRDLKDLVEKQVLTVTGTFKSTRYHLNLNLDSSSSSSA